MKTIEKSALNYSNDCDRIYQGDKYVLVHQINGLYYIYTGYTEICICETLDQAMNIYTLLENTVSLV